MSHPFLFSSVAQLCPTLCDPRYDLNQIPYDYTAIHLIFIKILFSATFQAGTEVGSAEIGANFHS